MHLLALLLGASLVGASPAPRLPAAVPTAAQTPLFRPMNLEDALAEARREERLVLLVFTRPASDEARAMMAQTWTNERVQEWIRARTVPLRLDVEWQVVLASRYEVTEVPTTLFLDAEDGERERIVGVCDAEAFLARAAEAERGSGPQGAARRSAEESADPRARLELAEAMREAGRPVAALQEMLAVFDETRGDADWDRERRAVLVPRILSMERVAPRARVELVSRRNRLEAHVLGNPAATEAEAGDLGALNRHLGEIDRSLLVWDKLAQQSHDTSKARAGLFPGVVERLLETRRYDEVLASCTDVDARLGGLLDRLAALGDAPEGDPRRLGLVDEIEKRALWHYHALLGAGRLEASRARAEWLLAFDGGQRTYVLLIRHAAQAGDEEEAYRYGGLAMQRLPEGELYRVHAALNDLGQ